MLSKSKGIIVSPFKVIAFFVTTVGWDCALSFVGYLLFFKSHSLIKAYVQNDSGHSAAHRKREMDESK